MYTLFQRCRRSLHSCETAGRLSSVIVRRSNIDCVGCVSYHCVPRRLLPHSLYLCFRQFLHTAPVSFDDLLWDMSCGSDSTVVCVIYVPTYCAFCARCCFEVIDDVISHIFHLLVSICTVFLWCVRRHWVVAAVGKFSPATFLSTGQYGAG